MVPLLRLALTVALIAGVASAAPVILRGENNKKKKQGLGCDWKKGAFNVEKGGKCKGKFEAGKGAYKRCEGGYKAEFEAESSAEYIAHHIADGLTDQIDSFFAPDTEDLLPPEDAMESIMKFDDLESLESVEDGFEQVVKFGGFAKMEWGCKVTFTKKDGKFSKVSECGGKGVKGMGKAPGEDDILLIEE